MIRFACMGILVLSCTLSLAKQTAQDRPDSDQQVPWVLRKAIKEGPHQRYVGTRVVEIRHEGQTLKHTEVITRDGPNLRIEFPSGTSYAGQVIVETAKERRHYFPDTNEIQIVPPRREEAMSRLQRLAKMTNQISLTMADGEPIAGIPTIQVIVSDQQGNAMQKLFISKSGLLLKRQLFDRVGAPIGGFEFVRINTNPTILPGVFRLERHGAKIVRPLDMLRDAASKAQFPFAYIKESSGYSLMFSHVHKVDGNEVVMQFYANEGKRISLFQLRASVSDQTLASFAHDLQFYTWKSHGCTFVLVGGQDAALLKRLASEMVFGT